MKLIVTHTLELIAPVQTQDILAAFHLVLSSVYFLILG